MSQLAVNPHDIRSLADLQTFTPALAVGDYHRRDKAGWEIALALGHGNDATEFWANCTANLCHGGLLGITGALRNTRWTRSWYPRRSRRYCRL